MLPMQNPSSHGGFPQQYVETNQKIIEELGVSNRLGKTVLNELDYRATNLIANLSPLVIPVNAGHSDAVHQSRSGYGSRFESIHGELIQNMDSIDTHYAVKRNRHGLDVPATPKQYTTIEDAISSASSNNNEDREAVLYSKRARNVMGNAVERLTNSPITDITRRIRRLRMHMSTPREHHREKERQRRRSSIMRQSLASGGEKENNIPRSKGYNNLYNEFKNDRSSLTSSKGNDVHFPTFAKPTITSIKKMNNGSAKGVPDSGSVFSTKREPPASSSPSSTSSIFTHTTRQHSTSRQNLSASTGFLSGGFSGGNRSSSRIRSCEGDGNISGNLSGSSGISCTDHIDGTSAPRSSNYTFGSDNGKSKPKVIASKSVFERLYNSSSGSTNQKPSTIRKSKTQGDLAYIRGSKHNENGPSLSYESNFSTRNGNGVSTISKSTTMGDLKSAKAKGHLTVRPGSAHKYGSTYDLATGTIGSSANASSKKPLWR
ncbi:HBL179Cp [Eremothecium sinecaudum]|uniref:HBL179Cp n=1 Tax=Eremothecium sinecaudum TaxID=45286 RepID=A0A109UW86_9SACH|nr:HBL179Cp [Eremothecium sinecaudum]AMD18723.1 HBL179Cp [Eremothecium sinecaudum]